MEALKLVVSLPGGRPGALLCDYKEDPQSRAHESHLSFPLLPFSAPLPFSYKGAVALNCLKCV